MCLRFVINFVFAMQTNSSLPFTIARTNTNIPICLLHGQLWNYEWQKEQKCMKKLLRWAELERCNEKFEKETQNVFRNIYLAFLPFFHYSFEFKCRLKFILDEIVSIDVIFHAFFYLWL